MLRRRSVKREIETLRRLVNRQAGKGGTGPPAASTLPRLPVPMSPGVEVMGVRPHAALRFTRLPLDAHVAVTIGGDRIACPSRTSHAPMSLPS